MTQRPHFERRAEVAEAKVLELLQSASERDEVVRHLTRRERLSTLQRRAREHEDSLQQQAEAAEEAVRQARERALQLERVKGEARELALQLERVKGEARSLDARPVAQALSGGVCTASHAELEAATHSFAASSILGRGGFGPVYRGEWGGRAVAIKRLDQASVPICSICCTHRNSAFMAAAPVLPQKP